MGSSIAAVPPIGVLLMAYGSPDNLSEMEAYLLDVREGRPPSPHLIAEISSRYAQIGGRSPLLENTWAQARALEAALNRDGETARFRAYVGMRHWQPRIQAALVDMAADGIQETVALVMAPHSSRLSTGKYFAALAQAREALGLDLKVYPVESWHDRVGLIAALASQAQKAQARFGDQEPYVIFTAHSLPARILEIGDPYDGQLRETARMLADRLGLGPHRWQFCYQSAGASPGPWLGPQIESVVVDLALGGEKNLLVVPIGFVCDHVEVLYDIDIGCRELAERHSARLERSPSLNAEPVFIAALADLVQDRLAQAELWEVP